MRTLSSAYRYVAEGIRKLFLVYGDASRLFYLKIFRNLISASLLAKSDGEIIS